MDLTDTDKALGHAALGRVVRVRPDRTDARTVSLLFFYPWPFIIARLILWLYHSFTAHQPGQVAKGTVSAAADPRSLAPRSQIHMPSHLQ